MLPQHWIVRDGGARTRRGRGWPPRPGPRNHPDDRADRPEDGRLKHHESPRLTPGEASGPQEAQLANSLQHVHRERVDDPEPGHNQGDHGESGPQQRKEAVHGRPNGPRDSQERCRFQRARARERLEARPPRPPPGRAHSGPRRRRRPARPRRCVASRQPTRTASPEAPRNPCVPRSPRPAERHDVLAPARTWSHRPYQAGGPVPIRDGRRENDGATGVECGKGRRAYLPGREHEPAVRQEIRTHDGGRVQPLTPPRCDREAPNRAEARHALHGREVGAARGSSSATGRTEVRSSVAWGPRRSATQRGPPARMARGDAARAPRGPRAQCARAPTVSAVRLGSRTRSCGSGAPRRAGTAPRDRPDQQAQRTRRGRG